MAKHKTPMLDELEKGRWPSFVSDMKQEAAAREKTKVDLQAPREAIDDLIPFDAAAYSRGLLGDLAGDDISYRWRVGGID